MSNFPLHRLPGASSLTGILRLNGASVASAIKLNLTAIIDPGVGNDSSQGYGLLSMWLNTVTNHVWICANTSVGAAVWEDLGGSGGGGVKETITVANAFSVGNTIRKTAGGYVTSKADTAANSETIGVVETASGAAFTIVYAGKCNLPAHGYTVGAALFLSGGTAGLLTETEPTTAGQVSKPLAIVLDANYILWLNMRGATIGVSLGVDVNALTNANVTLTYVTNAINQKFTGNLSGPVTLNISRTNASAGNKFYCRMSSVGTTPTNLLLIQENGSGTLIQYDGTATLKGQLTFVYSGSAWELWDNTVIES